MSTSPWRADFPALAQATGTCAYLDSAAMTLRPNCVIDAVANTYRSFPASVHRGQYAWAESTTAAFEHARERTARRLNALKQEIVFTKNCTEAINIVAHGLSLSRDDEVLVPVFEHHSNYLPWRRVARVREIGMTRDGRVDLDRMEDAISRKTAVIALTYASNVTGVIQPIEQVVALAKKHGLITVVDGAQAASHLRIDVEALGCDFMALSSHKMFGPAGVGVLWGREDSSKRLAVYSTGGGMVDRVGQEISYLPDGRRFEAGTANIEGVIGFAAALDYAERAEEGQMNAHVARLAARCRSGLERLSDVIELPFHYDAPSIPILSFKARNPDMSAARLASILSDTYGVFVRDGVHCCQPLFTYTKVRDALRVSLQCYNDEDDVDRLLDALENMRPLLAGA
ncbi:aminotransferase class V-fold PLP-dependent enzyme [Pendulispora albinea]|uniref:Aminotransferase class V-fold PLP-dependent enzyme n=1 Tax=Pendulispora albinea TaxID=2741071 RepID=A0ABZ2LQV0_9BACT